MLSRFRRTTPFTVSVLIALILPALLAGILSGCRTDGGDRPQGLQNEKPAEVADIRLEHPVAPQGLLVRGSRVFVVAEEDGCFSVVEVSLESGEKRTLVGDADRQIAVSREGDFLAYGTRADWGEPCEVWLLSLDTGEKRKLAETTGPLRGMDFSPDGKALVFASCEGLAVVDLAGEGKRVLVEGRVDGERTVLQWRPVWSPDGTRIAYAGTYYEGSGPIFVVDVETASVQPVTGSADVARHHTDPLWSPDGKQILYTHSPYDSLDRECSDVWVADLTGKDPRFERITPGDGLYRGVAWSPDGRYVLVERVAAEGEAPEVPGKLLVYDCEKRVLRDLGVSSQGRMVATWADDGYVYYVSPDGNLGRIKP